LKITNSLFGLALLVFANRFFGMQTIQKKVLLKLASSKQINAQNISEAIDILKYPMFNANNDNSLDNILNIVLFKIAQAIQSINAEKLAEILVNSGANPDKEFIIYEMLSIGKKSEYSQTLQSYKTTATYEAQGAVKEYLRAIKGKKPKKALLQSRL
jgi:hypothetical protein